MSPPASRFAEALAAFPPRARTLLGALPRTAGRLSTTRVGQLCDLLGTDPSGLAALLVPVAAAFSRPFVSCFRVGAVLQVDKGREPALVLGANMEFPGADVHHTLHAEQVAVANGWLSGASRFTAIAVSAVPCGHCRQFLYEVQPSGTAMTVITPQPEKSGNFCRRSLGEMLPHAFGPADLGVAGGLDTTARPLDLPPSADADLSDPDVREAVTAAAGAYAPYTGNRAGCTLVTTDGNRHSGRSMENAAYNPGLSAFQTALVSLYMTAPDAAAVPVERVVLVETAAAFTQRGSTVELLRALAPEAAFDYYSLTDRTSK
jgi:cytidine deaminase